MKRMQLTYPSQYQNKLALKFPRRWFFNASQWMAIVLISWVSMTMRLLPNCPLVWLRSFQKFLSSRWLDICCNLYIVFQIEDFISLMTLPHSFQNVTPVCVPGFVFRQPFWIWFPPLAFLFQAPFHLLWFPLPDPLILGKMYLFRSKVKRVTESLASAGLLPKQP